MSVHDELGAKVRRAQQALEQITVIGVAGGVTVEVDAQGRLVAVSGPRGDAVVAAYRKALVDLEPLVEAAMREVVTDPQVESVSAFATANRAKTAAPGPVRARARSAPDDDPAAGPAYLESGW